MKETRGDVGIWRETFKVRAGKYEAERASGDIGIRGRKLMRASGCAAAQ